MKLILSLASWIIPLIVLVYVAFYVRSLPPSSPSKIISQSSWMIVLFGLPAAYFVWEVLRNEAALNLDKINSIVSLNAFAHARFKYDAKWFELHDEGPPATKPAFGMRARIRESDLSRFAEALQPCSNR